jgi:hypothetical protein
MVEIGFPFCARYANIFSSQFLTKFFCLISLTFSIILLIRINSISKQIDAKRKKITVITCPVLLRNSSKECSVYGNNFRITEQFDKYYARALRILVVSSSIDKGFWM